MALSSNTFSMVCVYAEPWYVTCLRLSELLQQPQHGDIAVQLWPKRVHVALWHQQERLLGRCRNALLHLQSKDGIMAVATPATVSRWPRRQRLDEV